MFELILMSGILFFIVYLISIGRKKGEKTGVNKKNIEVALQELQVIWKGKERVEIELEKLVRIWKGYEEQEKEVLENVEFKHDEILEFYINYLRGRRWFKGRVKEVILEILKILDEKGEVSSVVKKGEVYELDNNTYELLMRVPLYRHSLNVAKKILGMGISGLSEPQAVICALGHDLGKIPEFFGQFYSLGDHPVVSVAVLKGIRGFLELPYAEAVEKAILYHHKAGKGKLVEYLKKADGLARKEEVEVEREKVNRERSRNKEGGREEEIRKDGVLSKSNQSQSSWERERNSERENSEGEEGEGVIEYDLSWLPIERFLKDLKGEINRVRDGRFIAFSMSDGVIYVHPQGLWNLIKKFAIEEKVMEICFNSS